MSNTFDAIVIGAGHNGLTTACYLAKGGKKVLVLEQRPLTGGLAIGDPFHREKNLPGVLWDTSAVSPGVVKDLNLSDHGLAWEKHRETVFVPQAGGPGILLSGDHREAAREIATHSKKDADQYLKYHAFLDRIRNVVNGLLIDLPVDVDRINSSQLWGLVQKAVALRRLGKADMYEVLRILLMCAADWLNEWFECDLLKAALAAPALYGTNLGPWSPGSNANLVLHECRSLIPISGGPPALIGALQSAASSLGVEIRTDSEVDQITVENDRVSGVLLKNGQQVPGNLVMASCHPRQTFSQLLRDTFLPMNLVEGMSHFRSSGTTAMVNLVLQQPLQFVSRPQFDGSKVRICSDLDGLERSFDPIKYRTFSNGPVLEIHQSQQAKGECTVSLLVHFVPRDLEGGWDEAQRERLGKVVRDHLRPLVRQLDETIIAQQVLTPADLESRYGLFGGHIHHGEHGLDQLLVRPALPCADYSTPLHGLYLCGSGSRPGGGLTCLPGMLAAKKVLHN